MNSKNTPIDDVVAVVLAGGRGTRLYPLSTPENPKQFLKLACNHKSLLQQALLRAASCNQVGRLAVMTGFEYRHLVDEQIRELWPTYESVDVILETVPRNTAPAIAYTCMLYPESILLFKPSDHFIADLQAFCNDVHKAVEFAKLGYLVTFGITPNEPHTGYGYIERGAQLTSEGFKVKSFKEKPNMELATQYIKQGNLWNGGIFCFQSKVFLQELAKFSLDVYRLCREALSNAGVSTNSVSTMPIPSEASFAACPSISIDYAVMEKTQRAAVLETSFGWSDLGSWGELNSIRKELGLESLAVTNS